MNTSFLDFNFEGTTDPSKIDCLLLRRLDQKCTHSMTGDEVLILLLIPPVLLFTILVFLFVKVCFFTSRTYGDE
jgi:hypothetical protein